MWFLRSKVEFARHRRSFNATVEQRINFRTRLKKVLCSQWQNKQPINEAAAAKLTVRRAQRHEGLGLP